LDLVIMVMAAAVTTKAGGGVSSVDLWRTLDSGRITGRTFGFPLFQNVYLDLHCLFGFRLDLYWIFFGFGFNGVWNSEEHLRLSFVSLVLFYFVWKALGQRGSVD
jgi:hypothetical protein